MYTDKREQSRDTKAAAEMLERWPIEAISGFIPLAVLKEQEILEKFFALFPVIYDQIDAHPEIQSIRIAKNHAQLAALLEILPLILPLDTEHLRETREAITQLAVERMKAIQSDQPKVQEFWESFDYLDAHDPRGVNHSPEPGAIAVNFNHFVQVANEHRQPSFDITEIKKLLKTGRRRKFCGIKSVRSKVNAVCNGARSLAHSQQLPEVVRCWIFDVEGC